MKFKWAVGAAIAVAAGMFALPGLASAHEASLSGEASECRDAQGAFTIDWTLSTFNVPSDRELDWFDDTGYDTGGNDPTESPDNGVIDVVDGGVAPSLERSDWTVTSSSSGPTGQTLDSDGIHGNGTATAQTAYDGSSEPNSVIYADGRVQWTSIYSNGQTVYERNVRSNDIDRPDYCRQTVCKDGDFVDQAVNELNVTNDCDPVRICLDGESRTVTEFQADQIEGATEGSCTPSEPPPPPKITEEEPVPEPEPEEVTAEVSPAVEEVAALPSAGHGTADGSSNWLAVAALSLISLGVGAGALVVARRS